MNRALFSRVILVAVPIFAVALAGCPLPYDYSGEGAGSLVGPDPSSPSITAPVQISYDPQDGLDGEMSVTLRTDTENATIYYTNNGSAIDRLSSANKISGSVGSFTLVANTGPDTWTIYAIAIGPGLLPSPVAREMVTVNPPTRTLPDEPPSHLYIMVSWGTDIIYRAPLSDIGSLEVFIDEGLSVGQRNPNAGAFDYAERRLFWLDSVSDDVSSADAATATIDRQWSTNINPPSAIAIDPENQIVYWGGNSPGLNRLYRSDYDGGNQSVLAELELVDLAYDRFADVLIGADQDSGTIYRIEPDGTAVVIYNRTDVKPRDLDIDQSTGRIYFITDAGSVYSIAENGTDRRLVAPTPSSGSARAFTVDPYNGYIYWGIGNANNGTVYRARLDGSEEPTPVINLPGVPGGLVLGID